MKPTFLFVLAFLLLHAVAPAQRPTMTKDSSAKTTLQLDPVQEKNRQEKTRKEKEEHLKNTGDKADPEKRYVGPVIKGDPNPIPVTPLPKGTPKFITDSLDKYIERGMRDWQIPGLAISIVKDGKVIFRKGYGVRELGKTDKVDENTLFIIASNSKLFTGTALAKLDHEKKLSLNDKITQFIPWFTLYDAGSTRLANIRDMLSHRIGTKTFQGDFTFWNSNLPKDSIIWKMRYLRPTGEFRQDYGYCNSCFVVAGQVLEKVAGQSWEDYVSQYILLPLGMNNTYMNTADLGSRQNVASPHNNLYANLSKLPFDKIDNMGPATSMVSNVADLSKWLMLQLDSGKYQGKQILPWQVIQKTRDLNILTTSRRSTAFPTHFRGYGLGVFSTDYNGRQVYWHTGGAFGHVTNVCFIPEEKLGITILTNNDNQSFFEALRYQIMDAYMGVGYTDRSKYMMGFFKDGKKTLDTDLDALKTRVAKKSQPAKPWEDYTGTYTNTVYGNITISKGDNMLICRFQHHPDLIGYMEYMDNNEFRITYSNIGYGIYPAKFFMEDNKVKSVEIKANDFVESDSYLFNKTGL